MTEFIRFTAVSGGTILAGGFAPMPMTHQVGGSAGLVTVTSPSQLQIPAGRDGLYSVLYSVTWSLTDAVSTDSILLYLQTTPGDMSAAITNYTGSNTATTTLAVTRRFSALDLLQFVAYNNTSVTITFVGLDVTMSIVEINYLSS